jgi:hypothetical protein
VENRSEPGDEPLGRTVSLLSIRADRKLHHNKLISCRTRHKAYELGVGAARPLEQSVRLSVLYKPRVELSKLPLSPVEMAPVTFRCFADARPAPVNFSWFVDDHQVAGAHEPELYIGRLTRQLHLREIKCQASNALGTSSAIMRMAVRYAPAYVTHLLPASLQPEHHQQGHHHLVYAGQRPKQQVAAAAAPSHSKQAFRFEQHLDQLVARELALAAELDEEVTLRCDFDSNLEQQPQQIEWYKINTDFSNMKDVTPEEADELIASGANHAQFKNLMGGGATQHYRHSPVAQAATDATNRDQYKRHINQPAGGDGGASAAADIAYNSFDGGDEQQQPPQPQPDASQELLSAMEDARLLQLDFAQMSLELLDQVNRLNEEQANQRSKAHNASLGGQPFHGARPPVWIESMKSEPASKSNTHKIFEPLAFSMRRADELLAAPIAPAGQRMPPLPIAATRLSGAGSGAQLQAQPQHISSATHAGPEQERAAAAAAAAAAGGELILLEGMDALELLFGQGARNQSHKQQQRQRAMHRGQSSLLERQAQLTSSSLPLGKVNDESVGKYVCVAPGLGPKLAPMAKSVFFVLKERPRIVSTSKQWAPLAARELQVECLAQINTVQDNQTHIQWFKDGKVSARAGRAASRTDTTE